METQTDLLPREFLRRLSQLIPEASLEKVSAAFSQLRPTTFRVNTLKMTVHDAREQFERLGVKIAAVPFIPGAYILVDMPLRQFTDLDIYTQGCVYVQSLSSMLPPLILDPRPGSRVLDITAAPGSKTTQMAALMANTGAIIANDISRVRNYRLKANLDLLGVSNTTVTSTDARSIWQTYPEAFDYILADVPCSMEGRFFTGNAKTYKDWSLKKVKDLAHLQKWILRSAVSAAKPGGVIVYSTCTLSPEENEEVVNWLLEKEGDAVALEQVSLKNFVFNTPRVAWADKKYASSLRVTARIYPSRLMEGFYIAKLRKVKSNIK